MEKNAMSFVQAMLDFFGKNGKDTKAFMEEIKALTDEDRKYFRTHLAEYYELQA